MASYLGDYPGAATNREDRFRRAVDSFLAQGLVDKKLMVVSDGCMKTLELLDRFYPSHSTAGDPVIRAYVQKQGLFDGRVRNMGISSANAETHETSVICYLDTDDVLFGSHLSDIANEFNGDPALDWAYYNDYIAKNAALTEMAMRGTFLSHGCIGTSSIAHRSNLGVWWEKTGYGHDWAFIRALMGKDLNHRQIKADGYLVCHIPGSTDF